MSTKISYPVIKLGIQIGRVLAWIILTIGILSSVFVFFSIGEEKSFLGFNEDVGFNILGVGMSLYMLLSSIVTFLIIYGMTIILESFYEDE